MKKLSTVLVIILSLVGCNSSELYVDKPAEEKSIMVPAGLSPTAKAIKNTFRKAGWQTFVTGGQMETQGSGGKYINVNTKAKYPARYSAWASGRQVDVCLIPPEAFIVYDISIVDNVTGEEVAAFSGRACRSKVGNKMEETLAPFL